MKIFESRKINTSVNLLELTPIQQFETQTGENGLALILVPRFKNKFLIKYLLPKYKTNHIKVKLDKTGSGVWMLINGTNTVQNIIDQLTQQFPEIENLEKRLYAYFTTLYENKYINFKEFIK